MQDGPQPSLEEVAAHLLTPAAIRERCGAVLALAEAGRLDHFALALERLDAVVDRVEAVTREAYPDGAVPYHSRWRHLEIDGGQRLERLAAGLAAQPAPEQARARIELAVTSVLLDAGAGPSWRYREPVSGRAWSRSEGLALASFDLFLAGGQSGDPEAPLQADAAGLRAVTAEALGAAFQVTGANPLIGLEGRAALLRRLGEIVAERSGPAGRLGAFADDLLAAGPTLGGDRLLGAVLELTGPIWPDRLTLAGRPLGDVWAHPALGDGSPGSDLVPFHKLAQWLSYSLVEPLEDLGVQVDLAPLTGLPEYRNGGLLVDLGLLVPKHAAVTAQAHAPGDPVIVEWRALTLALLDRIADALRARLGLDAASLPLAKVLQGGTWAAGRAVARERRPDGTPPIRIASDGTVF